MTHVVFLGRCNPAPAPSDPERPCGPLRPVPGREDAAALADRALRTLYALTGDEQLVKDTHRSLIRAGIVELRKDGE